MRTPLALLLLLPLLPLLPGCEPEPTTAPPSTPAAATRPVVAPASDEIGRRDNANLLLGDPSLTGPTAGHARTYRPQFDMSYSSTQGGPNWVAWHLQDTDLGRVERSSFRPDPLLPENLRIRPSDYKGSGFDRGHVCPSGDRTRTEEDNEATFVMSNMLPQTPDLNQRVWKSLEDYGRDLAERGFELYQVAGGVGTRGRIARGKVNVPAACWKIMVVLSKGNNDLARITPRTRVIAVLMPNREGDEVAKAKWSQYLVSPTQIERVTGLKFFSNLAPNVRAALLAKVDTGRDD